MIKCTHEYEVEARHTTIFNVFDPKLETVQQDQVSVVEND
jgi:hypothetical protein